MSNNSLKPSDAYAYIVMHICFSRFTIIGSGNGMSPGRHQAIIWTNAGILLVWPLGTKFCEKVIKIQIFSFKKMLSVKWWPFCLCPIVLNIEKGLTKYHKHTRTELEVVQCYHALGFWLSSGALWHVVRSCSALICWWQGLVCHGSALCMGSLKSFKVNQFPGHLHLTHFWIWGTVKPLI